MRAGEWIFHEGDAAESLFIVRSGRIEILDEGPPETLIRILRRGEVVGELALLREGTRSASVRARRDAELLELGRVPFENLIREAPSFALGLTRTLGAQLAASRMAMATAALPRTIAVIGLDPSAPGADVAELLADALSTHGSVARLGSGELATIDRAEREADRVVLRCDPSPDADWTQLCLREAHLVLAVSATRRRRRGGSAPPRSMDASFCSSAWAPRGTCSTHCSHAKSRWCWTAPSAGGAIDALGRRIAGRSLGLVLSGGGARALAHLGVLAELRESGLRFDRVAGVSLGSSSSRLRLRLTSRSSTCSVHSNAASSRPTPRTTSPCLPTR